MPFLCFAWKNSEGREAWLRKINVLAGNLQFLVEMIAVMLYNKKITLANHMEIGYHDRKTY